MSAVSHITKVVFWPAFNYAIESREEADVVHRGDIGIVGNRYIKNWGKLHHIIHSIGEILRVWNNGSQPPFKLLHRSLCQLRFRSWFDSGSAVKPNCVNIVHRNKIYKTAVVDFTILQL